MAVSDLPEPGVTPGGAATDWRYARELNTAIESRYQENRQAINSEGSARTSADDALASQIATETADLQSQIDDVPSMIDQAVDPIADLLSGLPIPQDRKVLGPVSTDAPTITANAAPDGSYNKSYLIAGGVQPATWPIDVGPGPSSIINDRNWSTPTNNVRLYRFNMDGLKMAFQTQAFTSAAVNGFLVYVDGAPVSLTPTALTVGGTGLNTLVWGTAKPRLVEILTDAPIGDVYTHNPYRIYPTKPRIGPRVLAVGDSYTQGVAFSGVSQGFYVLGAYGQMPFWLGTENWWTDGVPGSGYLRDPGAPGNYRDRIAYQTAANPDVVIVHGGGANDLFGGFTVPQIVAEAITYFTALRAALPNAKLVFVEGFSPPVGFSTFNDEYIDIRTQLQAALTSVGVYYINVATSSAWLDGSGYVGNTTGSGNSDIYVGGDGVHLTYVGAQYILTRLAQKYRTVLADDGSLVNTLI